ncbi:hypothetical protein [Jiangella rhizosphaerae]|uniref:DUF3558 domain-containing protein n=1 Tax=Jiangella rhizosphaerae TaxID=2293569 RepID=A0A418KLT0_9ACTN|nr:hypothetical protein [Jiangella rhizosphaerae]RIQ18881.1 hypothetical protein DY240_20630 [Jiangella rhizosphaerae]
MQLEKGAAVCGLVIAALVAGGGAAAPASAASGPPVVGAPVAGAPVASASAAGASVAGASDTATRLPGVGARLPGVADRATDCRPMPPPRHRRWLDGFVLGWVPPGLGPLVTDFEYEWEDVAFRSRVWESGPYPDESYRVDLQITVMRSPSFTDVAALRAFLVGYLERDPAVWATEPFAHPDGPGFTDAGELFWLAEPGVAVRVFGGGEQIDFRDLTRTACAVRQVMPMN